MSENGTNGTSNGNGHDAQGHFTPGNKKAKGRPPRDGKRYQAILHAALTPRKWQAIVLRAIDDAINGDEKVVHHARTFIANYSVGKPDQTVKIGGADLNERLRIEFVKDWVPGLVVEEPVNADHPRPSAS